MLMIATIGANSIMVAKALDKLNLKEPLEQWSDETIERVISSFMDEKFPSMYNRRIACLGAQGLYSDS